MDLRLYRNIWGKIGICQNKNEWQIYMEIIDAYFRNREISNPIIVELGVERGGQKPFYEQFINACHIGIDFSDKHCKPDILGDVFAPETLHKLRDELQGKPIDLLFIDLDVYDTHRKAYALYAPMVKHIIAMHSIARDANEVGKFWNELEKRDDGQTKVKISCLIPEGQPWHIATMGIGLIFKDLDA